MTSELVIARRPQDYDAIPNCSGGDRFASLAMTGFDEVEIAPIPKGKGIQQ